MNPDRIRDRIPCARPVGRATLKGWRVVERFYADIEKSEGGDVHGVLYLVTPTELRQLDVFEGYPNAYKTVLVDVFAEVMGCEGAAHRIPALAYVMTEARRRENEGKPYPEDYRVVCAAGADHWKVPSVFGSGSIADNRIQQAVWEETWQKPAKAIKAKVNG